MMILMLFFLAFWFLMIAPQRRKQKEQERMISQLKAGDLVMTASGIIGTVVSSKNDRLVIKTVDSKIEVHKSFVQVKLDQKSAE